MPPLHFILYNKIVAPWFPSPNLTFILHQDNLEIYLLTAVILEEFKVYAQEFYRILSYDIGITFFTLTFCRRNKKNTLYILLSSHEHFQLLINE